MLFIYFSIRGLLILKMIHIYMFVVLVRYEPLDDWIMLFHLGFQKNCTIMIQHSICNIYLPHQHQLSHLRPHCIWNPYFLELFGFRLCLLEGIWIKFLGTISANGLNYICSLIWWKIQTVASYVYWHIVYSDICLHQRTSIQLHMM